MAHFRGTLVGNRGMASRLGTAKSGLQLTAGSWSGAVHVNLYVNTSGVDCAHVTLSPHINGQGNFRTLYDGPVSGKHS